MMAMRTLSNKSKSVWLARAVIRFYCHLVCLQNRWETKDLGRDLCYKGHALRSAGNRWVRD